MMCAEILKERTKKMVHASCTGARLFDNKNGTNVVWLCMRYFSVSVALFLVSFWTNGRPNETRFFVVTVWTLFVGQTTHIALSLATFSGFSFMCFKFLVSIAKKFKREADRGAQRHKMHCIIIFLLVALCFLRRISQAAEKRKKRKIMNQVDKNAIKWKETQTKLCSK